MNKDFVYKRRLLALADLLDKLPPKKFDYSQWVGDDWKGRADLSCGTVACAFGHATTMPSLRRLGLRLVKNNYGTTNICLKKGEQLLSEHNAAREIFGLNYSEFNYLFLPEAFSQFDARTEYNLPVGLNKKSPSKKASAKAVANHIRYFVKHKYSNKNIQANK